MNPFTRFAWHTALVLSCMCASSTALKSQAAPDPKSVAAAEMLDGARNLSSIQLPSTPSYRLQASFQTFDYKGKPDGEGTVLQSFVTGGTWRRNVVYRGKHAITYASGQHARLVVDPDFEGSLAMDRTIEKLFTPIPDADRMRAYTYKAQATKFGALELQCIVASLPYQGASFIMAGPLHRPDFVRDLQQSAPNAAYCLSKDSLIVRAIEGHDGLVFSFNRILKFGDAYFAGDISMQENGKTRVRLHVDAMTGASALKAEDIQLPAESSGGPEQVRPDVASGKKIGGNPVVYPFQAKEHHVQGTVILTALIGRDGSVRDLELVSAPDDALVPAAMDAVRTWKYSPFLVAAKPIEVTAQITVNFQFR